jgi:protein-disulfide isomerase
VALIEFSDFQCPFCGQYTRETYGNLQRDFVDTGRVEYVFRHFPIEAAHPLAFKAAEAAECALEQGKFWEMHDRLFADQMALSGEDLIAHANRIALSESQFTTCLNGSGARKVKEDQAEGIRLGVTSTPTFLIGEIRPDGRTIRLARRIRGARPYETFRAELESMIAGRVTSRR